MKGQRVAAIIEGSSYQEDLTTSIENVILLKEYFTELHIIYPVKYEMPENLRKRLAPLIYFHHYDELTPSLISHQTLLLVHIQPDHVVDENVLIELLESAQENRKRCDHYAIRGKVDCKYQNHYFLGFVWIIAFMDFFRTIFNAWGYHTKEDLRATKVTPVFGGHPIISEYKHAWFFSLFSRIASVRYHPSLLLIPKDRYSFRSIYNHPHMSSWNLQWIIVYIVYYICFSIPWWNLFLHKPTFTEPSIKASAYIVLHWIAYRNIYNPVWLFFWCVQLITCMAVVASRFKNGNLSWVFLMPLYLTLSPIMFLAAKNK